MFFGTFARGNATVDRQRRWRLFVFYRFDEFSHPSVGYVDFPALLLASPFEIGKPGPGRGRGHARITTTDKRKPNARTTIIPYTSGCRVIL